VIFLSYSVTAYNNYCNKFVALIKFLENNIKILYYIQSIYICVIYIYIYIYIYMQYNILFKNNIKDVYVPFQTINIKIS